jgi:hypothetical protein
MARWLKNTKSAAVKISLRSLTCWERKNRNSVDADSASVSSAVGTQPIARSSALTDSPKNRPDCLVAIQPPKGFNRACFDRSALFNIEANRPRLAQQGDSRKISR